MEEEGGLSDLPKSCWLIWCTNDFFFSSAKSTTNSTRLSAQSGHGGLRISAGKVGVERRSPLTNFRRVVLLHSADEGVGKEASAVSSLLRNNVKCAYRGRESVVR